MDSIYKEDDLIKCSRCRDESDLDFDFTMAFQPIVNLHNKEVVGYEALVRGLNNESAYSIISRVNEQNRYAFDQQCRIKAISLASQLKLQSLLSINFLPKAIYQPDRCIRTTLEAAKKYKFPIENIMFEFTEVEKMEDAQHVKRVVEYYNSLGFKTAVDDFGAGYSGLGQLANFQTDLIKIDMGLVRSVHKDNARQIILKNCIRMMDELNISILAEGVETEGELRWLTDAGIVLMQGYLFAKPGFEELPSVTF